MKNGDEDIEMADVSDFASDEEDGSVEVPASAASSSDVDSEYGERTLPLTTVTKGSSASMHEFYRAAVRRQNFCFGAGVISFAGLFVAAYFLMGLSFSPSVIGIFGDELSMKGGSGEVGLDASNAETQEIVDEEVAEIEKAGRWGDVGAPSANEGIEMKHHPKDLIGHDHVGNNKWTEKKGWWKDNAGNFDESHMTKRQKHKFEKMKKKQAERMKQQDQRLKKLCKKRPQMPRCQGKQDTDIDSIMEKLSQHYNYEATGDPKENSPASNEPPSREGDGGQKNENHDGSGKGWPIAEEPFPGGGDGPVEEEKGGADDEEPSHGSHDGPVAEEPQPEEPSLTEEGPDGEVGDDSTEEDQNETEPGEPSPGGENGLADEGVEETKESLGSEEKGEGAVDNGDESDELGLNERGVDDDEDEDDIWEYDWAELTDEQKDAAKILGFHEVMWDSGGKSPACQLLWDELDSEQQHAAILLGQDRARWGEPSHGSQDGPVAEEPQPEESSPAEEAPDGEVGGNSAEEEQNETEPGEPSPGGENGPAEKGVEETKESVGSENEAASTVDNGGDGPVEEDKGGVDDEEPLHGSHDGPVAEEPRPEEPSPADEGPDGEVGDGSVEEEQNESEPGEPSLGGENGPAEEGVEVSKELLGSENKGEDAVDNGDESDEPGANGRDVDDYEDEDEDDIWDYDWVELTDEQKNAAKILGFHEAMWDSGGKSPACQLLWDELDSEQQHAANLLGQDRSSWGEPSHGSQDGPVAEEPQPEEPSPAEEAPDGEVGGNSADEEQNETDPGEPSLGGENGPAEEGVEETKESLSSENEAASTVDNSGDGPVEEDKGGADGEEPSHGSHDGPVAEEPQPEEPSPAEDGPGGEVGDGSAEEEKNESELGEPSLGSENGPAEDGVEVAEESLSSEDEATGAVDNGDESDEPGAKGQDVDDDEDEDDIWEYDWAELTDEQKNAAAILGFHEAMWDSGGKSPACQLLWDELDSEQQHAANLLGQDRAQWDGDGGDDGVENVAKPEERTPDALLNVIVDEFRVLEQVDHDPSSFTQGLSYGINGTLFETTGLYRESKVRRIDPNTFDVELSVDIDNRFFGEGSTVYIDADGNERLIEITWKEQTGFIYDTKTLDKLKEFKYTTTQGRGNEGWGITYDASDQEFIVSDGSQYLYFWDRDTLIEKRKITVTRFDGNEQYQLNELEYMDGHICMNIWQSDDIICVDPMTGKSVREYDMSSLWPRAQRGGADVLNGIALGKDHVLLTGKRWDRMYKVDFPDWPSLF